MRDKRSNGTAVLFGAATIRFPVRVLNHAEPAREAATEPEPKTIRFRLEVV